jgi:hypothetical protein
MDTTTPTPDARDLARQLAARRQLVSKRCPCGLEFQGLPHQQFHAPACQRKAARQRRLAARLRQREDFLRPAGSVKVFQDARQPGRFLLEIFSQAQRKPDERQASIQIRVRPQPLPPG